MDTFVVRVWGSMADEEEETGFRGVVEHVASGRSERFHNSDELVSFLRAPGRITDGAESLSGEV